MNTPSLLLFLKEIDLLKKVERQTLIHSGGRRENSAEHSWHLAMAVVIFQDLSAQPLNLEKAMKMALIHDIVEIDAGDTFVYGDLGNKKNLENAAIERIMNLLPEKPGSEFKQLWHEFEERSTAEAKYVAALDKFLPLYSNTLNQGYSWQNHNVPSGKVFQNLKNPAHESIPRLWEIAQEMIENSIKKGELRQDHTFI